MTPIHISSKEPQRHIIGWEPTCLVFWNSRNVQGKLLINLISIIFILINFIFTYYYYPFDVYEIIEICNILWLSRCCHIQIIFIDISAILLRIHFEQYLYVNYSEENLRQIVEIYVKIILSTENVCIIRNILIFTSVMLLQYMKLIMLVKTCLLASLQTDCGQLSLVLMFIGYGQLFHIYTLCWCGH